jgi:PKD repeat protein
MRRMLFCALVLCPLFLSGCVFDSILGDAVNRAPRAVIDVTPDSGGAPLAATFDAHYSHDSDGSILEYRWDFGDPVDRGIERGTRRTHTYRHAGTYLATLTVVDDQGAIHSQQVAIVVTNAPPVPQASASSDSPLPGRKVLFDASTSYDPDGTIMTYQWDFGDDATANGEIVTHAYSSGGYYVVTLTVTDSEGEAASMLLGMNVLLGQGGCGDGGPTCGDGIPKPYAVITGIPPCSGGKVGVPIRFDGYASRPGEGATRITSYIWDLGDGTTATGPVVTHVYTTPQRSVLISLTVTNEFGETNTAPGRFSIGMDTCP